MKQDAFDVRLISNGVLIQAPPYDSIQNVAAFSSIGPTSDGRLKPDIVTPGRFIVSAHSDGLSTTPNFGVIRASLWILECPLSLSLSAHPVASRLF